MDSRFGTGKIDNAGWNWSSDKNSERNMVVMPKNNAISTSFITALEWKREVEDAVKAKLIKHDSRELLISITLETNGVDEHVLVIRLADGYTFKERAPICDFKYEEWDKATRKIVDMVVIYLSNGYRR